MKVRVIAGARSNFMKLAPTPRALCAAGCKCVLVHSGQYYNAKVSDTSFAELGPPHPDHHLEVGTGFRAVQPARAIEALEPVVLLGPADWLAGWNMNSTFSRALGAGELKEQAGTRVATVEARLRSGDWRMPWEVNRTLPSRSADLLQTRPRDDRPNLAAKGSQASNCSSSATQ
jgi:UDP-N-acetylglucosamine 2-epimerase (non-hydrolysing)